jgi:hypothetical protein
MVNEGRLGATGAIFYGRLRILANGLMAPIGPRTAAVCAGELRPDWWPPLRWGSASNASEEPPGQLQASFQLAHGGLADSADAAAAVQFGVERRV